MAPHPGPAVGRGDGAGREVGGDEAYRLLAK